MLEFAVVLLLPTLSCVVLAQDEDSDQAIVDEIVVIGTHIRQVDPDGPSPVLILDRDALERTGVPTVAEALERLPFGNNGSFNDSNAFSSAIGGTGISFRGLDCVMPFKPAPGIFYEDVFIIVAIGLEQRQ